MSLLTPKERLKADEKHISINTEHAIKVAEKSLVHHFEQAMPAVKTTADNATNTRASHSVIGHLMNTEEKPAQRVTNERRHHNMAQESTGTQNQGISQANNTPGNIILANMKTSEPINTHLHSLVSQLVERVQILVPNLAGQNKVQLILEQGKLKGTEITITLQNNQLTVTLAHNGQHTELLKKMYPELLERLQRLNTDQHVRIVTMNNEQNAQHSDREQGHQQESNQKSRILDYWLEDQENA